LDESLLAAGGVFDGATGSGDSGFAAGEDEALAAVAPAPLASAAGCGEDASEPEDAFAVAGAAQRTAHTIKLSRLRITRAYATATAVEPVELDDRHAAAPPPAARPK
jgi:hypothetical protein